MARKKKEEPAPIGAPAWMNTYGDMVTLLLTFFVLLFSFSTIDAAKWREIVISFSGSPGAMSSLDSPTAVDPNDPDIASLVPPTQSVPPTPTPTLEPGQTPLPTPSLTLSEEEIALIGQFDKLMSQIGEYIHSRDLQDFIEVERISDQILIRFKDSALFNSASADLRPDSTALLDQIIPIISESSSSIALIRIEGHTDNIPIHNARFPSNWELSTGRACSVLRYILENSAMDATIVTASGSAEQHPIDTNATDAGRARNRRVDIVVDRRKAENAIERLY